MDVSDASDDVRARVVCASVCVCFWIVFRRAMVSLEGRKERVVEREGAEAVEEVERVVEMVEVVEGMEVRERAGDWANEEAGVVEAIGDEEMKGVVVARVRAKKRLHSGESVEKRVLRHEMRKNASRS